MPYSNEISAVTAMCLILFSFVVNISSGGLLTKLIFKVIPFALGFAQALIALKAYQII